MTDHEICTEEALKGYKLFPATSAHQEYYALDDPLGPSPKLELQSKVIHTQQLTSCPTWSFSSKMHWNIHIAVKKLTTC